jgi:hypothetical protein
MLSCVCSATGEPQRLSETLTLSVGTLTSLPNRSVWEVWIKYGADQHVGWILPLRKNPPEDKSRDQELRRRRGNQYCRNKSGSSCPRSIRSYWTEGLPKLDGIHSSDDSTTSRDVSMEHLWHDESLAIQRLSSSPLWKTYSRQKCKSGVLCTVRLLILSSLKIILQISNRLNSHLLRWFQELSLRLTQVCLPIPSLIFRANSLLSASGSDVKLPRCCLLSPWSQLPTAAY